MLPIGEMCTLIKGTYLNSSEYARLLLFALRFRGLFVPLGLPKRTRRRKPTGILFKTPRARGPLPG
jgi:hypothetical protein